MKKNKLKDSLEELGLKVKSIEYWEGGRLINDGMKLYGCVVCFDDPIDMLKQEGLSYEDAENRIFYMAQLYCNHRNILAYGSFDPTKEVKFEPIHSHPYKTWTKEDIDRLLSKDLTNTDDEQ